MSKRAKNRNARPALNTTLLICVGCGYTKLWPQKGHVDPKRITQCHKCGGTKWHQ